MENAIKYNEKDLKNKCSKLAETRYQISRIRKYENWKRSLVPK